MYSGQMRAKWQDQMGSFLRVAVLLTVVLIDELPVNDPELDARLDESGVVGEHAVVLVGFEVELDEEAGVVDVAGGDVGRGPLKRVNYVLQLSEIFLLDSIFGLVQTL